MKAKLKLEFIYNLEQISFVALQEKLHSLMNDLTGKGALDGFEISHTVQDQEEIRIEGQVDVVDGSLENNINC